MLGKVRIAHPTSIPMLGKVRIAHPTTANHKPSLSKGSGFNRELP